ncbi:MAG: DUF2085 domain-containing protein [Chitinophagaceae bacterium]|nr:MAG: DUF2085 domain-containing protein [Chitinophagaceae bacterium]HEX2846662.1 DUF2085 domain-containing protein [Chitinophagaceae bacterium]
MKATQIHLGCHGIPARCFKVRGKAMPFCARCLGASIGHLAGIPASIFLKSVGWHWLLAGLMIMLADWLLQNKYKIYHSNLSRLATGITGGFAVAALIIMLVRPLISAVLQ